MAKHRQRLAVINVRESIALGALVDEVVIKSDSDAMNNDFFLISADLTWSLRDLTAGEGPIQCGLAHGDYTVGEIQEHLNISGMEDAGDKIAQEQGRRLVRRAGMFSGILAAETLNDGKPIRTRGKFTVQDLFAVGFWAQNQGGATLTTGGFVEVNGKLYGRWL